MVTHLITRLSKLDAPDREVDAALFIQLVEPTWHTSPKDPGAVAANKQAFWHEGKLRYITTTSRKAPPYTASIDAAIALAERLFPGTEYEFTNLYNIVRVTIEMNGKYGGFHGEHANSLPIALLIALLRAKEASNVAQTNR